MDVIDEFNPEEWKIATGNEVEGSVDGGWSTGGERGNHRVAGGVPAEPDGGFLEFMPAFRLSNFLAIFI
jgi:hypothetical protein